MNEKKYDFFISHASEDKESFVRPLAEKLSALGYNIWYDEFSLKLGDSLVQGISNGIKNSSFGILVLSHNFFQKTWTKKELEALINKEVITNNNSILPIWFNINQKDVYEFTPLLVDKLAISANEENLDKVISEIEKKTEINIISLKMVNEKIDFLLNCNKDQRNKYFLDLENRTKNLFFYEQELYNWYCNDDVFNGKDWDDLIYEIKDRELREKYNLPYGVWHDSESHPGPQMNRIIRLCKKWTNRTLTCEDAEELHFLIYEYMDSDLHYILYGFPHSSIKNPEVYKRTEDGIYEVGVKKNVTDAEKRNAAIKVFDEYYLS